MLISNVDFKNRRGKFGLSSGKKGRDEKKLIQESLDVLSTKLDKDLESEPTDNVKLKQKERFKRTKKSMGMLSVVEEDKDFELLDEDSNLIGYNDVCDMVRGIHENIKILESDGSYLNDNKEKYVELRRILSELNDTKMRFVRTVKNPYGLSRRRVKRSKT